MMLCCGEVGGLIDSVEGMLSDGGYFQLFKVCLEAS